MNLIDGTLAAFKIGCYTAAFITPIIAVSLLGEWLSRKINPKEAED